MFIAVARPTLFVYRLLGHLFTTPKVPVANRRTASVGNCDKHDSDHLRVQCIWRRALTYLEATPTRCPFCFLQRSLPASRLASLPTRHVAKWHSVGRRIGTACSPRAMVL